MLYEGIYTDQISFPLGGIGTGSIGLSGSGRLIDWEIFGRPNKQSYNGYSHFAVKVEKNGKVVDTRVLNADLPVHYIGSIKTANIHSGYGFGPDQITMAGYPHFKDIRFNGRFPIAELEYQDESFNSEIVLTAFNPFIPLDEDNSSIPAAFFEFEIYNSTKDDLDYTIAFTIQNPVADRAGMHRNMKEDKEHYLTIECPSISEKHYTYGNITIGTDCKDTSCQEYWYRGGWSDGVETFWNDFSRPGRLKNRSYQGPEGKHKNVHDVGTLAAHQHVKTGEKTKIRFVLSWYYPNMAKSWEVKYHPERDMEDVPTWKNYYAKLFINSLDCSRYCVENFENLLNRTRKFRDALFSSTIPKEEMDAVSSNLSVLKSPTVLRLENGEFYGFEGCMDDSGCCEGSCQHVWNYAYALPFLFPKLERSIRELEMNYSMREDGRMGFRLQLPVGTPPEDFRACVDGQLGTVLKFYREWKISGDTDWLKKYWEKIVKALEFAWSKTNEDSWDETCSGVISGRQHHTLDMELFGPNSWMEGFYLCALKAAGEMAEVIGDSERANLYKELFRQGKEWSETHLFNGEYFEQYVDLSDKRILEKYSKYACLDGNDTVVEYWNSEAGEMKYQIGKGCMIDQVIGQWHANNCGLGEIFDNEKVKSALQSIFKYNYVPTMRNMVNTWRLYSLNDEGGVVICTWPKEKTRPVIPLTYNSETMNGFEYQFACHLIQEGYPEKGHLVVKSIRERYDGYKRNPYNEFECGSNYARSMASYGLLLAYGGLVYDMNQGKIGFFPPAWNKRDVFQMFWSLEGAWGVVHMMEDRVELEVLEGELFLRQFGCSLFENKWIKLEKILKRGEILILDKSGETIWN